ncbi:hypothetical protein HY230_08005 [Candidatus Acetothermia bacterium]|nr:hypothetical protein [Candidatus Acetothermia bacterium]
MAKPKTTIFEYEVDYEGALKEAKKIAQAIVRTYPDLSYDTFIRWDEGVFIEFYGQDEEFVDRVINSKSLRKRQLDLILEGKPIYFIYGGPTERNKQTNDSSAYKRTKKKKAR